MVKAESVTRQLEMSRTLKYAFSEVPASKPTMAMYPSSPKTGSTRGWALTALDHSPRTR